MTDLFRAIQESLRDATNTGIDLTFPSGATIGDKTYPAIDKALVLKSAHHEYGGHSFTIPLENRHRVQFTYRNEQPGMKGYAHSYVTYPNQVGGWSMGDSENWANGFEQHYPPFDTVHDRVKEYASEKSKGVRAFTSGDKQGFYKEYVPDDELQEHYKIGEARKQKRIKQYPLEASMFLPRPSHLIKIVKFTPGEGNKSWLYDVKTERLVENQPPSRQG